MKFRGRIIPAFAGALALLAAIGVLAYRRTLEQDSEQATVSKIHDTVEALDAVEKDLLDAETGQRGYIITGDPSYLAPYEQSLARIHKDFDDLRRMQPPAAIPEDAMAHLDALTSMKLRELKGRIDDRNNKGLDAAIAGVKAGAGKATMDHIRAIISKLKRDEEASLAQRSIDASVASRDMKKVILLGGITAFVLLFLSWLFVYQEMAKRKSAEQLVRASEERFRLMIAAVKDYAIFMLDTTGHVISWNEGAERIYGYKEEEIIGRHFSTFYPPEDQKSKPPSELKSASEAARIEDEGRRKRKDGSQFWANVIITALKDHNGEPIGFVKIVRDMSERKRYEEEILTRSAELNAANKELEAFCYSVSHDLRAPLRGIDGFSQAILEDYADQLDDAGRDYLNRIRAGTQRMAALIDDLLNLSRITRAEIRREPVDVSAIAQGIVTELEGREPARNVEAVIAPGLRTQGDKRLVRVALENLLGNAWKFTSKRDLARIEVGRMQHNGSFAFYVKDNGAGFDPAYSSRLFGAFQRLHTMTEFPGSGIGLATVQRIVVRHGGHIWAESAVDKGATFFFTL